MTKLIGLASKVLCVFLGAFSLFHLGKWMYHLYLQHELTGEICNFTLLLIIGLLFFFEGYIEYSNNTYYSREECLFTMIISIIALIVAIVIFASFDFSNQMVNFFVVMCLGCYGIFMLELPRLINAKRRIDYAKANKKWISLKMRASKPWRLSLILKLSKNLSQHWQDLIKKLLPLVV